MQKAKFIALIPIIFFSVSGGPYGLEEIVSSVGPINTLLLILILPVIWTIPETMIVAELASTYPVQGGYYRWVYMSLGRFWGFIEGWWSILYALIDLSLYPILFTTYLKLLFPGLDFLTVYFTQLLVIWISAYINILGIKFVSNCLTSFQSIILIAFIIFIFVGLNEISYDFSPVLNSPKDVTIKNMLFGLSLAFWNFIGWDNSTTILHEVDKPEANYHKALFITIPIIVIFYFLPLLVGLSIHTDWQNWKFGEFSYIANSMNCPLLSIALTIGGMITCLGLFNSLLLSSTRVFLTMSEDKLLPAYFSNLHKQYKTPYVAIIFLSFIFSILVLVNFQKLIIYDVFLYLCAIFLEAIALVILRKKNPNIISSFKIPFNNYGMYFFVGLACLVIILMVLVNLYFMDTVFAKLSGLVLLFSGLPIYFVFSSKIKKNKI